MKRNPPSDESNRFHSNLRHYHRAGTPDQRSWDDWVEGPRGKPKSTPAWVKILGIIAVVLILGGVATGVIIGLK